MSLSAIEIDTLHLVSVAGRTVTFLETSVALQPEESAFNLTDLTPDEVNACVMVTPEVAKTVDDSDQLYVQPERIEEFATLNSTFLL